MTTVNDFILTQIKSLGINVEIQVDEDFPQWILILIFLQAVLTFIGIHIQSLILFLVIFKWKAVFHKNLRYIAANTGILLLTVLICRFTIAFSALFNWRIVGRYFFIAIHTYSLLAIQSNHVVKQPFIYVEMLRVACGYASIFSVGAIVLERVIATSYLGSYERKTHPFFVSTTIVVIWLFGICLLYTSDAADE